jgi:phosphatidylethanolamine/phosphatidyl-N-methylethanolamine N-methyltransferase
LSKTAAFLWMALARPATAGALVPSSRALAQAMARAADGCDAIVELGAGTGAITDALCSRHPHAPLIAVEMHAELAAGLASRHPQVEVRAAAAHKVLRDLGARDATAAAAPRRTVVVSSLPFRSLPRRWRLATGAAIERFLLEGAQRRLVQYTYQPRAPFELRHASRLVWRRRTLVWRNAPPAWVWTLAARESRE